MRTARTLLLPASLAVVLVAVPLTPWVAGGADSVPIPVDPRLQKLVTDFARQVIPHDYENEKDWGKTRQVVRGLYVKREGWRIKTHRTTKQVNHGTWTKYRIQLLDPAREFHVQLTNVRQQPDQRFAFDLVVRASVRIFGRLSQWEQGVQLVSLSAEADADIELIMQCDLATRFEFADGGPGLAIDPAVHGADLRISRFKMRHISQLDGPLVRTLSATVREFVEDEIERRRERLLAQINRQLLRHRDKMHVSFQELLESAQDNDVSVSAAPQPTDGSGR